MIRESYEVAGNTRFYQNTRRSGARAGESPSFAAQLLSSRSLFSSGPSGFSGSASIFENRMLKILGEIARHIQNNTAIPTRLPASISQSRVPSLPKVGTDRPAAYLPAAVDTPEYGENPSRQPLGALSARFESGNLGVEAIGYDQQGGTSYGKYQISSRAGSMERFVRFLEDKAPDWASRLEAAGPANTGSSEGGMPSTWKAIAAEDPVKFGNLQHAFIRRDYYMPARDMILEQTGCNFDEAPSALQEVLWSTAVQHGPSGAARIFSRAADKFLASNDFSRNPQELIEEVFSIRSRQFDSSTTQVQNAVKNRFTEEKQLAFAMLSQANSG